MNKQQYLEYLSSLHWSNLRDSKLLIVSRCEKCGHKDSLQCHHVRYRNIYDYTTEDLQVLRRRCHRREHGFISKEDKKDLKKIREQIRAIIKSETSRKRHYDAKHGKNNSDYK